MTLISSVTLTAYGLLPLAAKKAQFKSYKSKSWLHAAFYENQNVEPNALGLHVYNESWNIDLSKGRSILKPCESNNQLTVSK